MKKSQIPSHFEIKVGVRGVGAFITKDIKKGTVLFKIQGPIIASPTRTSVQLGKNKHTEDVLAAHINHSCQPNAKVSRRTQAFVSLRDISNGEEITYNYNDNEDVLVSPFICLCCGKTIRGKKAVSEFLLDNLDK